MHIRVFANFQLDHFLKSKIVSESRLQMRISIFLFLKKNSEHFGQYLKSQKMDIPLYFQILLGQWEGVSLEIQYGLFRVFSPFLLNKSRQGG